MEKGMKNSLRFRLRLSMENGGKEKGGGNKVKRKKKKMGVVLKKISIFQTKHSVMSF